VRDRASSEGRFNYLADSVAHSLVRNGRVLTRRDHDGRDAGTEGVVIDRRELCVLDARACDAASLPTLAQHGFEQHTHRLVRRDLDFLRHEPVVREYYPECAAFLREVTGAAHVYAFDHNVRSAQGTRSETRIIGGQQVQPPAHIVHGDYTLTSAPQRLRDLGAPPGANDTLRSFLGDGETVVPRELVEQACGASGRFALINVWRNIAPEPVMTHPLALCDAQSVCPRDLVVFEIHYADRVGENYFAKYAPEHRWYFYPELTRDEVLLIKQWDSAGMLAQSAGELADASSPGAPCTFSFHSAFRDPATPPSAPDRWSIEVRCLLIYA